MLIIDVSIGGEKSESLIDTIFIRRTEALQTGKEVYEYEVLKIDRENKKWVKRLDENVKCEYGDYKPLLKKVLESLIEIE